MRRTREILLGRWLTIRVQIALGAIFVAAALPKIIDPPGFAQMIYNYRLVPGAFINALTHMLPWLELFCGMALLLGIWRRTAALIIGAMLVSFILALGINLGRSHAVNCGCFEIDAAVKSREQLFSEMRWVIIRDVGMLLMVGQLVTALSARARRSEEELEGVVDAEPAQSS
ncbi:MAG TPA: MauE/DoxX family redox-associated membrane protein [Thermoanaerobaculia bacterium]|nr:MauE/DoxX family redox-associated membrane protein [Thermoanaerobaculia bacterium]